MELTPLRYLLKIAQEKHVTRASRQLGVTQPALSAMLRKLEAEVGAPLLHRTGRGVELTDVGQAFVARAADAVRQADAAVAVVKQMLGLEHGSIRIGGGATAITYLLPRVVSTVRRSHPGLRFFVREAGSAAVASAVSAGELDLGIVTLPIPAQSKQDLLVIPLVEDELRLISPGDRKAGAKASRGGPGGFTWRDLRDEPIVAFEAGAAVRDLIDAASARAGVTLRVVMELRSIEGIKQMVAAGIGSGFVSRFALRPGEGLACAEGRLGRRLALVRRRDRTPSPAGATFERELIAAMRSA